MKRFFTLALLLPVFAPVAFAPVAFAPVAFAPVAFAQQSPPQNPAPRPLLTVETQPWRETKWRTVTVRRLEDLPNYDVTRIDSEVGRYGGLLAKTVAATGFFRAQKVEGRWWMVDPDGHLFLNRGVNAVGMSGSPAAQAVLSKKFGTKEQWAAQTVQLLREKGFNSTACWSDDALLSQAPQRLPYTPRWRFLSTYKGQRAKIAAEPNGIVYPNPDLPVFDAEFPAFCDRHAQQLAATKDDPYLIGHFSDNELPFLRNTLDNFLLLNPKDPNCQAALQWVQAAHGPNATVKDITDDDRQKFVALVGEKYFSAVSKAIKKYDPNHLYLGARFHSHVMDQPLFMQKVAPYLDIVSINYYGQWSPNPARMEKWAANTGKPFLITEFYAKGADTGMGNTSGAGWVVKTQRERGLFYEQFALGLLESRNCVGWHWFQYMDNDPAAPGDPSNINSNKGIINARYEPYPPLVDAMKRVNQRVYSLAAYFDRQTAGH